MAFTMSMGGSTGRVPRPGNTIVKFYESRRSSSLFLDPIPRPFCSGNLVTKGGSRCPVFFGGIVHGHGYNIFTARCSYASSAKPRRGGAVYNDDDEPMEPPPEDAEVNGMLLFRTHLEYPAIPNDTEQKGFAMMLHVKAPSLVSGEPWRPPVDLVAVLDASTGMAGAKLEEAKRAMAFVVDSLGPRDRLSVVSFDSGGARRVTRLTRMSGDGKAAANRALESLAAAGSGFDPGNVRGGLDEAAKVLRGSRHNNEVAGVILLSDGGGHDDMPSDDYSGLVPKYLVDTPGHRRTPVHAFVLGSDDHDSAAAATMHHHISEVTGGTFSFVEDHNAGIHGALARCAAGLRSLAAKDVWIEVECSGVRLRGFKSGSYDCSIEDRHLDRDWYWDDQLEFSVNVKDLYADEERRFLLLMDIIESADDDDDDDMATRLMMNLKCSYCDMATGQQVEVEIEEEHWFDDKPLDAGDAAAPSVEVRRELIRVAAAEDMAVARAAAERGEYAEAVRVLDARRESVSRSPPAMAGDAVCGALVAELSELSLRVANEREYKRRGRACLLAGVSAHARQRGSLGVELGCGAGSGMFATPAMRKMERLSETMRERQQLEQASSAPPEKDIPIKAFPRPRLEARFAAAAPRLSLLRRCRRLLPLIKR
ncbi:unnamed protein product [Urochloa decumbens]|uniref:VWFA domain-containing protein n=1 Tax=Urochloa decumbens TaxID=240449 RepID=A0ABC9BYK8_9POAL